MSTFPASELLTDLGSGLQGQNTIAYIKTTGGVWVPQSGQSDGSTNVADQNVLNTLESIDTRLSNIENGTTKVHSIVEANNMELYGLSTDTKPNNRVVGTTFFEVDTKNPYMWDGTTWELLS
jgi:hypothetical protein